MSTLTPLTRRLQKRFGIGRICIVADRGMISKDAIKKLEASSMEYILGVRMRNQKEVRDAVVSRPGRYHEIPPEEKLTKGAKSLIGNKGYRKYIRMERETVSIDRDKIAREARYDGKWVLTTNTSLKADQVALQYKQLWMVEQAFRTIKSVLNTRPIFHKRNETIRGHVFCSFLALVLMKELQDRLEKKGWKLEWNRLVRDLDHLKEIEIATAGKDVIIRNELRGDTGKVFRAAGVAVPPTVRIVPQKNDAS